VSTDTVTPERTPAGSSPAEEDTKTCDHRLKGLNLFCGVGALCQSFKQSIHTVLAISEDRDTQEIFSRNHHVTSEVADLAEPVAFDQMCARASELNVQALLASIPHQEEGARWLHSRYEESVYLRIVLQTLTRVPTIGTLIMDTSEPFLHTQKHTGFVHLATSLGMHVHSQTVTSTGPGSPLSGKRGLMILTRQGCVGGL
jgi:hypothetical protein